MTEEVKGANDQSYSFFALASKNPYVRVKVPSDCPYHVTFGNRNQGELRDLGSGHHGLNALLLRAQVIRVRWWVKKLSQNPARGVQIPTSRDWQGVWGMCPEPVEGACPEPVEGMCPPEAKDPEGGWVGTRHLPF